MVFEYYGIKLPPIHLKKKKILHYRFTRNKIIKISSTKKYLYGLFGSLERERKVEGRRVEENGYPLPCLNVFKISKREGSN